MYTMWPGCYSFRDEINHIDNKDELMKKIEEYFKNI